MAETEPPSEADLAAEFATIARVLAQADDIEGTLRRVVDAAIHAVAPCQSASVFLVDGEAMRSVESSDAVSARVDALQTELGEGPCLDAARGVEPYIVANDLSVETEYPAFGPRAAADGIRSVLALRLATDHARGALNMYAGTPYAFGSVDRAKGVILATHASTALAASESRADEAVRRDAQLHDALVSRSTIGQAQGILMERERITAEQAFDVLRTASQDLNVKLREIAQRVVDTSEDPREQ